MTDLHKLVDDHYRGLEESDLQLAVGPFAPDVVAEFPAGPVEGIEALSGIVGAFITAFPDMTIERRNTWQDGETAVVEVLFSGTQTGALATAAGEVPPSGRRVTFPLMDIFTARDGLIAEHRVYWDNVTFLTQLGLMPGQE